MAAPRILLALAASRQSPSLIREALEAARASKASLFAVFVLETEVLNDAFDKLGDAGILGEKPGRQLEAALVKEYRQKGYQLLDDIEQKTKESGTPCKVLIEHGSFVEVISRMAKAERVDEIFVKGIRRSWVGRLLFGSATSDLQARVKCPIRVVYD